MKNLTDINCLQIIYKTMDDQLEIIRKQRALRYSNTKLEHKKTIINNQVSVH